MFSDLIFFSLFYFSLCASSEAALNLTPCQLSDKGCVNKNSQNLYEGILQENTELGTTGLDPMHHDQIDGKLSVLSYTLKNSTIIGFSKCVVANSDLSLEKSNYKFTMECPLISMTGIYDMDGKILLLPVQGNGDYIIELKKCQLHLNSEVKLTPGEDGKSYMSLKSFTYTIDFGGLNFDLKNLFNGQKDLADPVLKVIRENWKEVAQQVQGPIVSANLKIMIRNLNKLLKTIPTDKLIAV